MRSLWLKLTISFVILIILVAFFMAVFINSAVRGRFKAYLLTTYKTQAEIIAPLLAEYYSLSGGWKGVDRFIKEFPFLRPLRRGMGLGMMMRQARIIVADENGTIVADSADEMVGHKLSPAELSLGAPIIVKGRPVGVVLVAWGRRIVLGEIEEAFLASVRRSLLFVILGGCLLAVVLGALMAYHITRPLRELRQAAARIAAGDLESQVRIRGKDEVAELAYSFNEMVKALKCQEEKRRQMLADIAHELRTPLSVLRGHLEALLDGLYPLDSAHLAPIYNETLLLQRLVEDLRVLSLVEAGKLPLEKSRFDASELVKEILGLVETEAIEKGLNLQCSIEGPLPVYADRQRIGQVIHNILANALNFTPEGGTVAVRARKVNSAVEISISDTGPGIPPEDLPHIFERFWRKEPSRSRSTGGSGLGLSIAKELVEAHGGTIEVQSTVGKGSTFTVKIPAG
ncbi:MAG: ATP-binding protein [Anaerolineae bacterium]|nr:ATP-binding protein [Anaerolineae bacterium]MDW8101514.1 ATP-binding protein [Anaerolineae bacterium]